MKDRTLIMLALVFLIFTIGSGVNKSFEAGNRMMGKDMAPGLEQVSHGIQPGEAFEKLKGYIAALVGNSGEKINEGYVQLAAKAEKVDIKEEKDKGVVFIKEKLSTLQEKASHLLAAARERVLAKKNEQAQ